MYLYSFLHAGQETRLFYINIIVRFWGLRSVYSCVTGPSLESQSHMHFRAGGIGTAGTAMAVPVFESEGPNMEDPCSNRQVYNNCN